MTWTLSDELCAMAGKTLISEALEILGIAPGGATLYIERDWFQAGAESFLLIFRASWSGGEKKLAMKAHIGGAGGLRERFDEILQRRRLIEAAGISTPELFGAYRATVVEEFISHRLEDVVREASGPRLADLAEEVFAAALRLDRLGFRGESIFEDCMSRGSDVVLVDFGSDLGSSGQDTTDSPAVRGAHEFLRKSGAAAHLDARVSLARAQTRLAT